jgi:hypothetical protein
MKLDAFLFLQRSDIAHYVNARPALGDIPHICIDPGLTEEAFKAGIRPNLLSYRPLRIGPYFQAGVAAEAKSRAALLDRALSATRRRLFGPGVFQGWDEGHLWLFLQRALVARDLGEACEQQITEHRVGLFRPDVPQRFYFDSFLSTDLFMGCSERWRVVDHYETVSVAVPGYASHCWDFERAAEMTRQGQAHAITHIPTCYDHHGRFLEAIAQRHPSNIDLPSPMWDVPVRRAEAMQVPVEQVSPGDIRSSAQAYRDEARQVIAEHLEPLVPGRAALHRQADSLAQLCHVQALNYLGLRRALEGTRPQFIVSDHDTGGIGPLFSVAAALDAPVTVLPHSSYPAFPLPHASRVRAIERRGLDTRTRTVLGEAVPTAAVDLGPAASPVERPSVRTVCLLVNTLYSQGLSHIDLAGLASFHATLAQACGRSGARLLVRLKPNSAALMIASTALEVSMEPLLEVVQQPLAGIAEQSDICVSYGEPTTGGIEFLQAGSYLICATEQRWPTDHWIAPGFVANGVAPCCAGTEAAAEVEAMLASPAHFRDRLRQQQALFQACRTEAQELLPA